MLGAALGEAGDEALRCRDETALAEHRLEDDRRGLAGQHLREEVVEPGEGGLIHSPGRAPGDRGTARRTRPPGGRRTRAIWSARSSSPWPGASDHGSTVEHDDVGSPGDLPGQLEGRLGDLVAREVKKNLSIDPGERSAWRATSGSSRSWVYTLSGAWTNSLPARRSPRRHADGRGRSMHGIGRGEVEILLAGGVETRQPEPLATWRWVIRDHSVDSAIGDVIRRG